MAPLGLGEGSPGPGAGSPGPGAGSLGLGAGSPGPGAGSPRPGTTDPAHEPKTGAVLTVRSSERGPSLLVQAKQVTLFNPPPNVKKSSKQIFNIQGSV